jgi:hypothetical protein
MKKLTILLGFVIIASFSAYTMANNSGKTINYTETKDCKSDTTKCHKAEATDAKDKDAKCSKKEHDASCCKKDAKETKEVK